MKKAFTLVELLIVVVIMATLMTIMFKIGSVSRDETARVTTVTRLQKLENCLSGYYSAFGSYPPVQVLGSQDIYTAARNGSQDVENRNESLRWDQVELACRSQPVDACFPFSDDQENKDAVKECADLCREYMAAWKAAKKNCKYDAFAAGFDVGRPNDFSGSDWHESSWNKVKIFKFGLMSYLLPRYLTMMRGPKEYYGAGGSDACAQWSDNNDECISALTGEAVGNDQAWEAVERDDDIDDKEGVKNRSKYVEISNMPTQAVCAQWIGNLEKSCTTCCSSKLSTYFGVCIKEDGDPFSCTEDNPPEMLNLYSVGDSGGSWYVLDTITVRDGWRRTFFYYSPVGAQAYTLWSAGPNGSTFPPWLDKSAVLDKRYEDIGITVAQSIADDIIRMNH